MNILLDTHIFLWYITKDNRLPARILDAIRRVDNRAYLSVVSLWEITIKYQLGRLPLPQSPDIFIPEQRKRHHISHLDLNETSVGQLVNLPEIHRGPFDRMLICQAIQHNLTLVTVLESGEF
jgi:PIN domain nuclease of toxin-antitoxin system